MLCSCKTFGELTRTDVPPWLVESSLARWLRDVSHRLIAAHVDTLLINIPCAPNHLAHVRK